MGVYLEPLNLEEKFLESTTPPIVVNDLSVATERERQRLDNLLSVRYDTDFLSNEPSCDCGLLRGGHRLGDLCQNCNTRVAEAFDQELAPIAWIRSPHGVQRLPNPLFLSKLCQRFTKLGFDIIEWLINTDYHPPVKKPYEIDELQLLGVKRGYNNFVENFDAYMGILFNLKSFKLKQNKIDELQVELAMFRDRVFTYYIPIVNKSLMVIENTSVGTYIDPIIIGALDAARMITGIDTNTVSYTLRQKENRTAKAMLTLCRFYNELDYNVLAKKTGMFRKHVFGSRNSFSIRAVISSITDPHNYDEVYLPWSASVTMLSLHITNKLQNRVNPRTNKLYTANEVIERINIATYNYDPVIDAIFDELIKETPNSKGFCVIFQRNPSLERGSAQQFFASKIKKNPNDPTISMSILAVKWANADFDGDAMNLTMMLDVKHSDLTVHLAPHKSMYDLNQTRQLAKGAAIPKPVATTISNWLHYKEPPYTAQELSFLHSLPTIIVSNE